MPLRSLLLSTCFLLTASAQAQETPITRHPLHTAVDLNLGEAAKLRLSNDSVVTVKLLELTETRDKIRDAVREAVVKVEINGETVSLVSANYRLPRTVGKVQID